MASSRKPVGHLPGPPRQKESPAGFACLCRAARQGNSSRTATATNLSNHAANRKKIRRRSRNNAGVYSLPERRGAEAYPLGQPGEGKGKDRRVGPGRGGAGEMALARPRGVASLNSSE